jgi:outer membrane protein OmpA-like peptidoglycan-associated protein
LLLGRRADLLDGVELEITGIRSPFRDILHYANVRLNFNLGNPSNQTEPLYWINPLQVVLDDIQELKEGRSGYVLRDSDGDGVPDEFDLEPNTPPGAIVDTRGRTLDSDRDGIPDHLDKEPYYTPREGEIVNSEGVVINPIARGGVTEDRVKELIQEALRDFQPAAGASGGAVLTDMFLPMIHFGVSSTTIKFSDYGTLASIGRILRDNANMRLVVTGYTDQTGSETQNQILSYERAKIVIDHLVNNHGVGRGRLVLHWGGQEEQLVPSSSSYMNRRVEFRVAKPNDVEMDPPANYGSKSDRY